MKRVLLTVSTLLLAGCASKAIYETTPSVYQLSKSNEKVQLGSQIKEELIREGKDFCRKKGGELVLKSQRATNKIANYQPSSAQIEFVCEFTFLSNRDYEVTENEVFAARDKYDKCLNEVISKVYVKTTDQDEIASLAFSMCKPDMKIWRYAKGYHEGKDRNEIDADIQNQENDPTPAYEAILNYQRKAFLTGAFL